MTAPEYLQKPYVPAPRYKERCKRPDYVTASVPCGIADRKVCVNCALIEREHPVG